MGDTRFDGAVAIVTGAAGGIGRATAERLAADGARVACCDVAPGIAETVATITEAGGVAAAVSVDVRDPSSVQAAVDEVTSTLGPVQVLANVAGVLRFAHAHLMAVEDWDLMVDVNLKGPYLMARAVIPGMLEAGKGAIVNVSSSAGMYGQAYNAGYCASKGGVVLLTKSLAWEYVKRGIRVNAIAPGGVDTSMTAAVDFPDDMDWKLLRKNMAPENQMLAPSQPAGLIAYLASDEADGITGTVVPIDWGITC
jgi:NAD(P)-dependent dehydrogenase (short-subunit alcohol dehydrogenase family)